MLSNKNTKNIFILSNNYFVDNNSFRQLHFQYTSCHFLKSIIFYFLYNETIKLDKHYNIWYSIHVIEYNIYAFLQNIKKK